MSHWQKGSLVLKCEISHILTALNKIAPEWEKYIETDPLGNLSITNHYDGLTKSGYHIKIKGGSEGCVSFADIGMKKNEDGTWNIEADFNALGKYYNLQNELLQEIAIMRQKELARAKGFQIIGEKNKGNKRSITIRVPVQN